MSSTPQFNGEQLDVARKERWHQNGDALLTLEAAREWVGELGFVLFAPRAHQLAASTPSLVEATLGRSASAPTAAETETARGLVGRMVAEGAALPLNLMGGPGDVPDFVVSAAVFSYVFTLRGDKAWKQPPATSGSLKVSLLAAKVYETLAQGNALTAAELASELGREVTETAIVRALGELWAQLRVIPLLQQGNAATMWEPTSRRFTKPMKAGANAGQPTALSALVSLYLAQVYAATEQEVETFLSPLAARSKVRDVLHGLTGARQLEEAVLEGKTLLYLPGALPAFPEIAPVEGEKVEVAAAALETPKKIGTGRIRSFNGERKSAGEFRGKARSFADRRPGAGGARPSARFGARAEGRSDRERRPFKRDGAPAGKPSFNRPWDEEHKPRRTEAGAGDSFRKFRKPAAEDRKPLGDREQAGLPAEERRFSKPKYERESRARDEARRAPRESGGERSFAKRPYTPRRSEGGSAKPRFDRGSKPGGFGAKRPYKPRDAEGGDRPKRPYTPRAEGEVGFAKPRFDRGGKPGGFGAKRPYKPRDAEGGDRPKRPYTPRAEGEVGFAKPRFDRGGKPGGFGAKRPYKARDAEGGERPFAKRAYSPRTSEGGFAKPRFDRGGKPGGFGAKRPYKPRDAEGGDRPKRPYTPRAAGEGEGPKRAYKPRGEGGLDRNGAGAARSFGPKKFGAKPGGFAAKEFDGKTGPRPGTKSGGKLGAGFGPKKFATKPGGFSAKKFGGKRAGPAGGSRPTPRKPKAEE